MIRASYLVSVVLLSVIKFKDEGNVEVTRTHILRKDQCRGEVVVIIYTQPQDLVLQHISDMARCGFLFCYDFLLEGLKEIL